MENKELIKWLNEALGEIERPGVWTLGKKYTKEITQRLREYEELKKLVQEVVDPIIELCKYSAKIPNFQDGDIKYGRNV